ncbi:hypothetical protein [Streptomyces sp. NPDC058330]|uniref:hypothetical protein n=1 Tax=Streptomyces sp. NPDC058330 TaxID=3346449 RepID=UPI0036F08092
MSSRRVPSGAWITVLLAGALAAVTVLAVHARSGLPEEASHTVTSEPSAKPSPTAAPKPRNPIPAESGTGRRVVYSIQQKRVWLVDDKDASLKTFTVWPGTIPPEPGSYKVSFRRETGTGSDGVPIEHAVYFGANSAFSNAVDGSSPSPDPDLRTSAIRESSADGLALWDFAEMGTPVSVVE